MGKNADGKWETVIIINIYNTLLLNGKIYTIQSQKDMGQEMHDCTALTVVWNECVHYVLLHPKWGKSLKVVLKWFHLQR